MMQRNKQEQVESSLRLDSLVSTENCMAEQFSPSYVVELQKACDFVRACNNVLVVSHVQPDGDAISSTLVIGWLLRRWNKTFKMVNENGVPHRLRYLSMSEVVRSYADEEERHSQLTYDMVICVDCADYSRIGKIAQWVAQDARILNIDHHPTNDHYGEVALIREDAAATAEILFDMLQVSGEELDSEVATMLYTGILTDTGGFRYSNTTPHVMAIASQLLKHGVDGNDIADRLLEKMSMPQVQLIKRGLSRLSFTPDQKIGWLYISPEDMIDTGALSEDLEGLVNYPRNIEGVEVGLLFKQVDETGVKVSMRSAGTVNVAEIAQHFGGGGHVVAAGCKINGQLHDVITMVVERVNQSL
ncbi:bifunctional oligoribonuclease/PAP phosphatase NrnA [Paenibacillus profundus]|uniref:Bifunctional oligoribonuclease/PAP phosphatase NrnA n=1 Tax=Paenibacillus profundus TaxID=1173085 RepID=A0ABS8YAZ3_9BACL|nr:MULTISPECIES: bifunctional oligoribonuclease/PAP phosphatase NrnA [Paenibacillus]MCE5168102.1 bifunctional oligoribonuclease/PAP phosphatase NrnA [Paenibacillus profundus]MCM3337350.1 bifunctional oligoribonuclease/PAP phosphatase NrnA [Paenibacillus sp. MER TA 81-3]